jgi:hypothetical protein
MSSIKMRLFVTGVAVVAIGVYVETAFSGDQDPSDPVNLAIRKGSKWLVTVQGKDGGWGQDGGETSYIRTNERLESNGNDVANTAVAAEALLRLGGLQGQYRQSLERAVDFILARVEKSPADGLAVTDLNGTQIQRKLGPNIDTFLTAKLLAELDGAMPDARSNARVRQALQKCVAKIEKNQLKDGSWNMAGGWAPILGTSIASQSLNLAAQKGVAVNRLAMAQVDQYTKLSMAAPPPAAASPAGSAGYGGGVGSGSGAGVGSGVAGGVVGGVAGGVPSSVPPTTTRDHVEPRAALRADLTVASGYSAGAVSAMSAGIPLYKRAQELEQLSRTDKDREANAKDINAIKKQLSDTKFVAGFGSVGGEEFFSYLSISDSLRRAGGPEWVKWNADMKTKLLSMQNADGTWAGHHCITGRVAVTSAAILLLTADRQPAPQLTSMNKK